jgi:hypothetical protein
MSHVATIKTELYDRGILLETLHDLNLSVSKMEGRDDHQTISLLLKGLGRNTIRFRKKAMDAAYRIEGVVEDLERPEIKKLLDTIRQDYARRKILVEARKKGFALVRQVRTETGEIKLVLRKVA